MSRIRDAIRVILGQSQRYEMTGKNRMASATLWFRQQQSRSRTYGRMLVGRLPRPEMPTFGFQVILPGRFWVFTEPHHRRGVEAAWRSDLSTTLTRVGGCG